MGFGENLISSFLQLTQNKKTPKKWKTKKYLLRRKPYFFISTIGRKIRKLQKKSSTQKYLLQRKHLQFDIKKENQKKGTKKWKTKKIPSSEKTLFLHFYNWTQNKKTKKKSSTQEYLFQRKHLQFDTKKENQKKRYKKMENQKNTFFGENIISSFLQLDAKKELQKKLHTKIPSSEKTST